MQDGLKFERYIVGLIDIQGQSEKLKKMDWVPATQQERERAVQQVRETLGVLLSIRETFQSEFEKFTSPGKVFYEKVMPMGSKKQEEYLRTLPSKLNTQQFCDTIIPYAPLFNSSGDPMVRSIYGVLIASGNCMMDAIARRAVVRGGIEIGVCTMLAEKDIYGAALYKAYRLEHIIANYPRIVVGDSVVNFLKSLMEDPPPGVIGVFTKELARKCLGFVAKDEDGVLIVDYLGQCMHDLGGDKNSSEIYQGLFAFVKSEKDRFSNGTSDGERKLADKYERLSRYFESRRSIWIR